MKERNTKQNAKEKAHRKLSSAEHAAVGKYLLRFEARPFVRLKASDNEGGPRLVAERSNKVLGHALLMKAVGSDDPEFSNKILSYAFLMDAVGSADPEFLDGILRQLIEYSSKGPDLNEGELNFLLSVISGHAPRDHSEAMLAAHMAFVHVAIIDMARRLANPGRIDEVAERALNRLTRTFALQLEALTRYRAGAEQKITLQQVSVAAGGKAIVGDVTQALPQQAPHDNVPRKTRVSPEPAFDSTNVVPMPTIDESKQHAPVARRRVGSK
jgi:hypothetical protein